MNCPTCGHENVRPEARVCPECGAELPATERGATRIEVDQHVGEAGDAKIVGAEVGRVAGDAEMGHVAGDVGIGKVSGDVIVQDVAQLVEQQVVSGDYVDRRMIVNVVVEHGDVSALDEVVRRFMAVADVDKQVVVSPGRRGVVDNVDRQITEISAAQASLAAQGLPASPDTLYRLGLLAAYRREYDEALGYLRRAATIESGHSDACESIAWLQQSRAVGDLRRNDIVAAIDRLADARIAAAQSDACDPQAVALRGYVAKTLAQLAEAQDHAADERLYLADAGNWFRRAADLDPGNVSALNGLGNVEQSLGHLDAAITAYRRAVVAAPEYAAAHHDLAGACEAKMVDDPQRADAWCREALQMWRRTLDLAPDDPAFTPEYIAQIEARAARLANQCR